MTNSHMGVKLYEGRGQFLKKGGVITVKYGGFLKSIVTKSTVCKRSNLARSAKFFFEGVGLFLLRKELEGPGGIKFEIVKNIYPWHVTITI